MAWDLFELKQSGMVGFTFSIRFSLLYFALLLLLLLLLLCFALLCFALLCFALLCFRDVGIFVFGSACL